MERFLILNADDFGRSEAVNHGVAQAFCAGIVTATSIVAIAPAFEQAVAVARGLDGLGVGIHLAADEYMPLLPPSEIPSLVTPEGCFLPRGRLFLKMALDPRTRNDLLREWDAQVSRVIGTGLRPMHLDGHGHCHAHPRVASAVLELANRYGITHVRLPVEPIGWRPERFSPARQAGKLLLTLACQYARHLWTGKLSFPDCFFGFSDAGRVTEALIRRIGKTAPQGISELMVHVGVSNDEAVGFRTGYDWKGDLGAVTSFTKEGFQKQFDVSLVPHNKART